MPIGPRAGQRSWRRIARRRHSTSGRCASLPVAEPAFVAGLYDGLAHELSLVDRWHEAADAGERALALWRAAGDRLREGDTLRRLVEDDVAPVPRRDSADAAEAAVATLEPLGPSPELAWAYAALAGDRMSKAENDAAIELARVRAGDRRAVGRV